MQRYTTYPTGSENSLLLYCNPNSPALLNPICLTAASHEAIARNILPSPLRFLRSTRLSVITKLVDALRYKAVSLRLLTTGLRQHPDFAITEATLLCVIVHLTAEAI